MMKLRKLLIFSVAFMATVMAQNLWAQEVPDPLIGVDGGPGTVGVTVYYLAGVVDIDQPIENQAAYLNDIANGDLEPFDIVSEQFPTLAVDDPTSPGGGNLQPKHELPGGGGDEYIVTAKGAVMVTNPGMYTFNIQSDDGFGMRFNGSTPVANLGGEIRNDILLFPNDTGNTNTTGTWDLSAGVHTFDFMQWEDGGGAFFEVGVAQGDFINGPNNVRPQYLALGDASTVAERVEVPGAGAGVLTGPLLIRNWDIPQEDQPLEFAREVVFEAFDDFDAESTDAEIFVIDDHNITPTGCPFGAFPHDGNVVQWPNTTGDRNDFASVILGQFTLDDGDDTAGETMEFTFHVDSDDRSYFRVIGQDFDDISAQELFEIEGDESMWGDVDTCNTNFSGIITLTEGVQYDFEALHVERGGDAGMQVLVAAGDFLFDPDPEAFSPLAIPGGEGTVFAANTGLPFVDPTMVFIPGDYNMDGVIDASDADVQAAAMKDANPDLGKFDHNSDGVVNLDDRLFWIKTLANTWAGDSNFDNEFSSADLVKVFSDGLYETGQMATWANGDWNGDMQFGSSDLVFAFSDGGYELGPPMAQAVPEPSSLALVLASVLGLLGAARRRG